MEKEAKNMQEPTFEITKDKLLHCLMHTATRENIAELRAENKADVLRLNDKLDTKVSKADVDKINDKLDTKASKSDVAELRSELKTDISRLDDKIERIADKLDKKLNKHFMWLVGLMFSGFAGTIVFMVKYLPLVINK